MKPQNRARTRIRDRLVVAGHRAAWGGVRAMPTRAAYRAFDRIADLAYRRNGRSVQRLRANYARVRPDLDQAGLERLVHAGMRSYLRYWCEAFRLPDRDVADLVAQVRVQGDRPVRADLAAGRGVVCFMGHLGNWDTAGAWSTTQLSPVTTVAERLKPEQLFAEFLAFRERLGMRILPLVAGTGVFGALRAAVADGALVPLLADRDLTATGVTVQFCGHPARMAAGPAALSVASGAALHPVSVLYRPDRSHPSGHHLVITFHDPVADPGTGTERDRVVAMTQSCADVLADVVRRHTEDWHMMQRVFVADLEDSPNRSGRGQPSGGEQGAGTALPTRPGLG